MSYKDWLESNPPALDMSPGAECTSEALFALNYPLPRSVATGRGPF